MSSIDAAFDKKGKCYEWLKIPLYNNYPGSKSIFFQKSSTNYIKSAEIQWDSDYDRMINWAFTYQNIWGKSDSMAMNHYGNNSISLNIFIMNYDE